MEDVAALGLTDWVVGMNSRPCARRCDTHNVVGYTTYHTRAMRDRDSAVRVDDAEEAKRTVAVLRKLQVATDYLDSLQRQCCVRQKYRKG